MVAMSGVVGVAAQSGGAAVLPQSNTTVNISRSDSPDMALKLVRRHTPQTQRQTADIIKRHHKDIYNFIIIETQ